MHRKVAPRLERHFFCLSVWWLNFFAYIRGMEKKHTVKHQLIAAVVTVSIMIWCAVKCTADTEPTRKSENTKMIESYVGAQSIVRGKLRAPSTAVFPSASEYIHHIVKTSPNTYEINSYVDSQNGFGATVRAYWTIQIHFENDHMTEWKNFKFKQ